MEKVQRGMMAWSQAGHDRGKLYVIVGMNGEYVWLCDGSIRPLENPKKKKWKHVQVMKWVPKELRGREWNQIRNEEIKRGIKNVIESRR